MVSALTRYLNQIFFSRLAILLFGIVSVVLSFDLLERGDNVVQAGRDSQLILVRYALLRIPDITSQLLPIASLLAAVLSFGELSRHRELDAMWASGVSPFRIIRVLMPAALILITLQFAVDNWGIPKSSEQLRELGVGHFDDVGPAQDDRGIWLRSGRDILRLPVDAAQAGRMENLTIFRRDAEGMLIERLDARVARPRDDAWVLQDVIRQSVESLDREFAEQLLWRGKIDMEQVAQLAQDPRELPLDQIIRIIENDAYGQRRAELYRTWLHDRFVRALTPFLMLVLVIALTQAIGKSVPFGWIFVSALAMSFIFFVFDRATLAMGEVGILPPWLAAWTPNLVLASLAGTFLILQESSRSVPAPAPMPPPPPRGQ